MSMHVHDTVKLEVHVCIALAKGLEFNLQSTFMSTVIELSWLAKPRDS